MKTYHLNIAAGVIAAACLAVLGLAWQERQQAIDLNRAILQPPAGSATDDEHPRVMLARGVMLARAGDTAGAQRVMQTALQQSDGELQNQARYNLGNLALRQALGMAVADVKLPVTLELAKQHYRDALLRSPGNLQARYNLERALWLAPEEGLAEPGRDDNTSREFEDSKSNEDTQDDKERATTTMKNDSGGLP